MAIKGSPIEEDKLTKEEILKRITTYDIYRYYFGPFKKNDVCINHLRGEKDESFIIGDKKSLDLTHKDFGDSYWVGDAFHLVQQIHRCTYREALQIINKDFKLDLDNKVFIKPEVITWEQPKTELARPPHFIVETRPFNEKELAYWASYYQDLTDLKRENIYAIKTLYRNRRRVVVSPYLTFGYYYPEIDRWKIYRPEGKKGKVKYEERKWDSNVPFTHIDGFSLLDPDRPIIIEKSKKDKMVMMKILDYDNICATQAEDLGCFDDESLEFLKDTIMQKVVIGDGDKKGLQYTKNVRDLFGWETNNPPEEFLPLSDYADIAKTNSLEFAKNLIQL